MIDKINFVPGDTVRIHQKIKEGEKTRIQVFEGVVLGIRGRGGDKTFMVRKTVGDIQVEKIFPVLSPNIEQVTVKQHSKKKVRHAKLYKIALK